MQTAGVNDERLPAARSQAAKLQNRSRFTGKFLPANDFDAFALPKEDARRLDRKPQPIRGRGTNGIAPQP